jgi:hypothetical protein
MRGTILPDWKRKNQFAYSINQSRYTIVCLLLVKENHVTNNALKSEREERPCWNFIVVREISMSNANKMRNDTKTKSLSYMSYFLMSWLGIMIKF